MAQFLFWEFLLKYLIYRFKRKRSMTFYIYPWAKTDMSPGWWIRLSTDANHPIFWQRWFYANLSFNKKGGNLTKHRASCQNKIDLNSCHQTKWTAYLYVKMHILQCAIVMRLFSIFQVNLSSFYEKVIEV